MGALPLIAWMVVGILSIAMIRTLLGQIGLLLFLGSGATAYVLAMRGGAPFREGPLFIASRWAQHNLLFPTQVAITPQEVIRYKKTLIGHEQESIAIGQIASLKIATGILWSDVIIESTGGAQPIVCHGHLNADAKAIKAQIEAYQQQHYGPPGAPAPIETAASPEPARPGHLLLTLYPPTVSPTTPRAPIATYPYALSQRAPGSPSLQALVLDLLDSGGAGSLLRISYQPDPASPPPRQMGSPSAQPAIQETPTISA